MELIIITGLSGAGKSRAVDALEDIDFYCVDNMPPMLIPKVAELCQQTPDMVKKLAVVSDVRGGAMFDDLAGALDELTAQNIDYKILFLDASEQELVRRYKETRRKHPLTEHIGGSLSQAVKKEMEILKPIRARADYVIDTTHLSVQQLKDRINALFLENSSTGMHIYCMSFGFKYGMPTEADLVFDVRCFPNPYYVDELRNLTGLDKPIRDFVMACDEIHEFEEHLFGMVDFLVPKYIKEGKSQLVIAIGCTGGKHRSVVLTEELYAHLLARDLRVGVNHRDIRK